jgi:hypothetical protein
LNGQINFVFEPAEAAPILPTACG